MSKTFEAQQSVVKDGKLTDEQLASIHKMVDEIAAHKGQLIVVGVYPSAEDNNMLHFPTVIGASYEIGHVLLGEAHDTLHQMYDKEGNPHLDATRLN